MKRIPVILSNLNQCRPASRLSETCRPGKWRKIPYETDAVSGTLLFAPEGAAPGTLQLPLKARGRYRIILGLYGSMWNEGGRCGIRARLAGERHGRLLIATPARAGLCEVPWKEADLDGQFLEISALPGPTRQGSDVSSIAYVKLVPVAAAAPKPSTPLWLAVYIDGHSLRYYDGRRDTPRDFAEHLEPFRGTPFRKVYWCTVIGDAQQYRDAENFTDPRRPIYLTPGYRNANQSLLALQRRGIDVMRLARDSVKALGLEFHIYHRPGFVHPEPPLDQDLPHSPFTLAHPEMRCRDRDGRVYARLSYAFPAVQERVIAVFKQQLEYGIDGINFAFWRGVPLMLYEAPLVRGFQRVVGRDPRRLKPDDPRWLKYRADFFTDFLRRLRSELEARQARLGHGRLEFSAGVLANARANIFYALDLERWIREGLVEVVIPNQTSRGIPPDQMDTKYYSKLKQRTGCALCPEIMSTRSWLTPEQHYANWTRKFYPANVEGFCFWDGDMRQYNPLEWEIMKAMADPRTFKRAARRLTRDHKVLPLRTIGGMAADRYPTWWAY